MSFLTFHTADVRLSTILPAIMLERWHHSSVSYSTQIQLAPQSSKLGSWLEIHIQGYDIAHVPSRRHIRRLCAALWQRQTPSSRRNLTRTGST